MDLTQNTHYKLKKPKRKKAKLFFSILFSAASFVVFLFIIINAFFPNTAMKVFGFKSYVISYTKSMEPVLKYNDLIVVKNFDFNKIEKGDIITFSAVINSEGDKIAITHEVVEIIVNSAGKRFLRTKGVNIDKPDILLVTEDGAENTCKYIGKYAFKSTVLGNVVAYFKSKNGYLTMGINFMCLTVIIILLKTSKEKVV